MNLHLQETILCTALGSSAFLNHPQMGLSIIEKMTTSKSGLRQTADLPQTADHLASLVKRCEATSDLIMRVHGCWGFYNPGRFARNFQYNDALKRWEAAKPKEQPQGESLTGK
jgi:hypothetical protein